MEKFFKLKENGTTVGREIVAGLTTFFAMAYIIVVNPNTLSGRAGGLEEELMPWGAVFLATIIASIIGTLVMGLVANVPYAQAPGMGLNAFFVYTVCLGLGFTWQQTLSMVFICGLINILITVTKLRKFIIKSIPRSLQNAIGGGIGIFVAYIGFLNVGFVNFGSGVPAMATLNTNAAGVQRKGRHPHWHCGHRHHRHPHAGHLPGQLHQLYRGLPAAAHHLWRHLHQRRPALPVLRCRQDPPGADYHLRLQHL